MVVVSVRSVMVVELVVVWFVSVVVVSVVWFASVVVVNVTHAFYQLHSVCSIMTQMSQWLEVIFGGAAKHTIYKA